MELSPELTKYRMNKWGWGMNSTTSEELLALHAGMLSQLVTVRGIRGHVVERPIGNIALPSGKIVATDPFTMGDVAAFMRQVAPGSYPVSLAMLVGSQWHARNAFATIKFTDEPVEKFEMALVPGNDLTLLEDDEFFGYGVDAGIGAFMDAQTATIWLEKYDDEINADAVVAGLTQPAALSPWVNFTILGTTSNFVGFESGDGDGGYASYWGLDAAGNVATLTTDFGLLHNYEEDEVIETEKYPNALEILAWPTNERSTQHADLLDTAALNMLTDDESSGSNLMLLSEDSRKLTSNDVPALLEFREKLITSFKLASEVRWELLFDLLRLKYPTQVSALNSGASEQALITVELALGFSLPEVLRKMYTQHDGEDMHAVSFGTFGGFDMLPLDEIAQYKQYFKAPADYDAPTMPVSANNAKWLPFAIAEDGATLFVDLAVPDGKVLLSYPETFSELAVTLEEFVLSLLASVYLGTLGNYPSDEFEQHFLTSNIEDKTVLFEFKDELADFKKLLATHEISLVTKQADSRPPTRHVPVQVEAKPKPKPKASITAIGKRRIRMLLSHLVSVTEPAQRLEFWGGVVSSFVLAIVTILLTPESQWWLVLVLGVVIYVLLMLVVVRRLVAINRPRLLVIFFIVPVIATPAWLFGIFALGMYNGKGSDK